MSLKKYKISVILTSFNHAKYLREAIDSTLAQTFTDFELIIWDDASTDNSWKIIQSYSDPRIKAFRNERQRRGVYGINRAITEIAESEYIAIHHSDDIWELSKLEKQVKFLDSNPETGAVFSNVQIIDEYGNYQENFWFDNQVKSRWQFLNDIFFIKNHLANPSVLIRKECYDQVGLYGFGLAQCADAEMWSRLLLKFNIHVLQEKLIRHRLFTNNTNASSMTLGNRIRLNNEWNVVRQNYLLIDQFDELVNIFPILERYRNPNGFEIKFLLAMVCLKECADPAGWSFGLNLLMSLIRDDKKSKLIKDLYNFDYKDLIKLTSEHDVYGINIVDQHKVLQDRLYNIHRKFLYRMYVKFVKFLTFINLKRNG
jgi:glycosyltransferase involved in cell wall biosynthesis